MKFLEEMLAHLKRGLRLRNFILKMEIIWCGRLIIFKLPPAAHLIHEIGFTIPSDIQTLGPQGLCLIILDMIDFLSDPGPIIVYPCQ